MTHCRSAFVGFVLAMVFAPLASAQMTYQSENRYVEVNAFRGGFGWESERINADDFDLFDEDLSFHHSQAATTIGRATQYSTLTAHRIDVHGEAWGMSVGNTNFADGKSYISVTFDVTGENDYHLSCNFHGLGAYHFNGPSMNINQGWDFLDTTFDLHDVLTPGTYTFVASIEADSTPGAPHGEFDFVFQVKDTSCPGDVNFDSQVDVEDLLALLSAWGSCEGCEEDFNDDNEVDTVDLLVLLKNWGPCAIP